MFAKLRSGCLNVEELRFFETRRGGNIRCFEKSETYSLGPILWMVGRWDVWRDRSFAWSNEQSISLRAAEMRHFSSDVIPTTQCQLGKLERYIVEGAQGPRSSTI